MFLENEEWWIGVLVIENIQITKNEKSGSYYENLMKLVTICRWKLLIFLKYIIIKFGLKPYLHIANAKMKRTPLQHHKEFVLTYEEGIGKVKKKFNLITLKFVFVTIQL